MTTTERSQTEISQAPGPRPGRDQSPRRSQALAVFVDERGIEAALRLFKRILLKEGLLKDLKRHAHFEKPGDRKRRKIRESIRRRRRQAARARERYGDRS